MRALRTALCLCVLSLPAACGSSSKSSPTQLPSRDEFALLDDGETPAPAETRWCEELFDQSIRTNRWDPTTGNFAYEHWRPGPAFGSAGPLQGNVGYSNADGTIVNGSPITPQPMRLACSTAEHAIVGWQFSNNVAGLSGEVTVQRNRSSTHPSTGETTLTRSFGHRRLSYLDPALTAPYYGDDSHAWFDESIAPAGTVSLTRVVEYGTADDPELVVIETPERTTEFGLYTQTGHPLFERLERSLAAGRPLLSRRLLSGTFVAEHRDGTTVTTEVDDVLYRRDEVGRTTCRPFHGVVTTTIIPARPSPRRPNVVVTKRYGESTGSADETTTVEIRCPQLANPERCATLAAQAYHLYGPSSCLY